MTTIKTDIKFFSKANGTARTWEEAEKQNRERQVTIRRYDIEQRADQGDVTFIRREKNFQIPAGFKAAKPSTSVIVAHSETGHHHVATCERPLTYYTNPKDPLTAYVKFDSQTRKVDIVHQRSTDTHPTFSLKGNTKGTTVWEIRRHREWTPEGWRRVED